ERGGEVRRHEGLAHAPFAAAERNQARPTVQGRSLARPADHLSPPAYWPLARLRLAPRNSRPAPPGADTPPRFLSPCPHPRFRRRDVQKRSPFFVANLCADVCEHRRPARLRRPPLQSQPRLRGRAAALAAIAIDAAAHHVLPGGAAA